MILGPVLMPMWCSEQEVSTVGYHSHGMLFMKPVTHCCSFYNPMDPVRKLKMRGELKQPPGCKCTCFMKTNPSG